MCGTRRPPSRRESVTQFVDSAAELARARPLRLRSRTAARRAALGVLARIPRARPRGVRIVHYHWVFPDELASFGRQLEWLRSAFEPVSLSEAGRACAAVT